MISKVCVFVMFVKSINEFDLNVGTAAENGFNLIFKAAGDFDGFQIAATGECVCADFFYGRGNGNAFQRAATPESHFPDFFKSFGEGKRFQRDASGESLFFNGKNGGGNGNGFYLIVEIGNDALTETDLHNGISYAVQNVFGTEDEISGGSVVFPTENRYADDLIGVLVLHGSDDIIVSIAVIQLGIFKNQRRLLRGAFTCLGVGRAA